MPSSRQTKEAQINSEKETAVGNDGHFCGKPKPRVDHGATARPSVRTPDYYGRKWKQKMECRSRQWTAEKNREKGDEKDSTDHDDAAAASEKKRMPNLKWPEPAQKKQSEFPTPDQKEIKRVGTRKLDINDLFSYPNCRGPRSSQLR